ncbi:MAG: hypothetical protein LBK71_04665 [Verrucomicrobiales bacterium]|nr:hypothetical protein [Verrucomicrobiales bacterium]
MARKQALGVIVQKLAPAAATVSGTSAGFVNNSASHGAEADNYRSVNGFGAMVWATADRDWEKNGIPCRRTSRFKVP